MKKIEKRELVPTCRHTCDILLVNDDPLVIAALHEALAGARHKLFVAPTVEAAIRALTERRCAFDTVLVNLDEGVDALALLGAAHRCCPQLPLVALTPWGERELSEQAFLRGATGLLEKPVTPDEVGFVLPCGRGVGCSVRSKHRSSLARTRVLRRLLRP